NRELVLPCFLRCLLFKVLPESCVILAPWDRDAVLELPPVEHGHDRFLGQLLEVIAAHRSQDDDDRVGFFDRKLPQGRDRTLPQGLRGTNLKGGRGGHHHVLLPLKYTTTARRPRVSFVEGPPARSSHG